MTKTIHERLDEHEEILRGDGNGEKGLIIKVDRHDQQLAAMRTLGWILIGTVSAQVVTFAGYLLSQAVKP